MPSSHSIINILIISLVAMILLRLPPSTRSFTTNPSFPLHLRTTTTTATATKFHNADYPISLNPRDDFPSWSYSPRPFFKFEILHESSKSGARVGRIHTPHGIVDTPAFVAVATNGALKGVDFRDADEAGQQLVFCNTYHLLLQPGVDVVREAGGLHGYTKRQKPFITDSGGFQVFSLAYGSVHEERTSQDRTPNSSSSSELKRQSSKKSLQKSSKPPVTITPHGATFRSYRDGSSLLLTPESTIQAQKSLGADIILPLDELPPYHTTLEALAESVTRSHAWMERSLREHLRNVNQQACYGIVHGGLDEKLRRESLDFCCDRPFDGIAIGGSLGKNRAELKGLLEWFMPWTYEHDKKMKPRHLLGIADEESVRMAVSLGIDSMDSCYPTRLGRHGTVLTKKGTIHVKRLKYAKEFGVPLDEGCECATCRRYDRAYVTHLFRANEPLAMMLTSLHNVHYMNNLMGELRRDILEDRI